MHITFIAFTSTSRIQQVARSAIAERPRCRVGYGQNGKTGTERQYLRTL